VARNRKRAKERRSRRPQPSVATARADHGAPDPIAHAAPDGELAEAQLARGRPPLDDGPTTEQQPTDGEAAGAPIDQDDQAIDPDEEAIASEDAPIAPTGQQNTIPGVLPQPPRVEEGEVEEEELLPDPAAAVPATQRPTGNRLINFLQGSWRELQRVQWPDRRQVVQATGVVIGFVIVAGLYLGAADWAAGKIVNLIIK
jgi:preprotein translocase subunit SecE